MVGLLSFLLRLLLSPFRPISQLEAENAALRRQLMVLQCQVRGRVQFTNSDRTETSMRPIDFSRWLLASLAGAVAAAMLAGTASPQNGASYPTKPIRIVVGFAAGGGNDLVARIVGPTR